jgi:hypothetical protein
VDVSFFSEMIDTKDRLNDTDRKLFSGIVIGTIAMEDNQTVCNVQRDGSLETIAAKVAFSLGARFIDLVGKRVLIFTGSNVGFYIISILDNASV